jgi:release factor glutamine methyltransferase
VVDRVESMWTVAELLRWTVDRFEATGIPTPRVDAEYLLAHALGCSRLDLYVRHDAVVDADARARFREVVRRRLAREPVAYIEGRRGFHALGLELAVDTRVLVPRPETEHLVDWVLEELPPADRAPAVLDVGTGSGAIALAIKHARCDARVVACDVSDDALAVARANADALGLAIELVRSDLLASIEAPDGGFAAVAANLPYVATADFAGLQPEVVRFEPRLALDGGIDGLDLVRRLVAGAADVLAPGGTVHLEIAPDQAAAVQQLLRACGFGDVAARPDHAGLLRVVRGRRG